MADTEYAAECQRAELLGIAKPDYEEFLKNRQSNQNETEASEDIENELLQDADVSTEKMGHISGGLEELNSILQVTQRKINRFKASCGSLTNLLKFKLGQNSGSSDSLQQEENNGAVASPAAGTSHEELVRDACEEAQRQSDLARALDSHVDKLDSLIDKAERAHISMNYQNKEMKRAL